MEEVIDRINAASSPEELAIHFLMRHARCRMALTGTTEETPLQQAPANSRLNKPASQREADGESNSKNSNAAKTAPAAAVARADSCADRFSRAYVAARHMSAPRYTLTTAEKTAA